MILYLILFYLQISNFIKLQHYKLPETFNIISSNFP